MAQLIHVAPDSFPWATFWTNISGSFALGLVLALLLERFPPSRYLRPFVATGFLGAYTTYSTFAVETVVLVKDGHAGLAGASVFRGVEGYGASNHIHTTHILSLLDDLPIAVVIVDRNEAIQAFLPQFDELIDEGLVIIDDVEVLKYVGRTGGNK